MKNNISIKKIALIAIFITLSLILSYVDNLIPINIVVPGIKIGLANLIIIYSLYMLGIKEAIFISIIRVVISSILFGSILTFVYSLTGAIVSLLIMVILKSFTSLTVITISIIGGVMHNMTQIIVAIILMNTKEIVYYLPILILTGVISGMMIGIFSTLLIKFSKNNLKISW